MSTRSAPARRVHAARATSTTPLTCGELAASVFGDERPPGVTDADRRAGPVRSTGAPSSGRRHPGHLAPSVMRLVVLMGVGSLVTVIALAALFATILLITG
ncbi:MAG: hypothetical protein ABS81_10325 [Pseudonocardia sp. SCN 72-86]|nr:MAG: hypothetical protein ABS81_10325 [Pseudonocardia sp. SCN 72-86]